MRGGATWLAREARAEPVEEHLAALLPDPGARVLVGTIDGVTLGYAVCRLEPLRDGSILGVVTDVFVEEPARGVGLGDALLSDLEAWCRAEGCAAMDAMALPGHRAAKNFFEQHGFTARMIIMHHRLQDPAEAPGGTA